LRKLAAAALALPVVAFLFVPMLVRRSIAARIVLAIVLSGLLGLGAIGISRPLGIAATPPSKPVPLTSAAFRTDLRVRQSPAIAVQIAFSTAMESGSVESSLRVEPPTSIDLAWNADRTLLTVSPRFGWRTGTYHTITVAQGALAATGRPLTAPVRAVFLTRPATAGSIAPTRQAGDRIGLDAAFVLAFDRPVDLATLRGALVARPALAGTLEPVGRRTQSNRFVFTPTKPLVSDSRYELSISGAVRDLDGAALANAATLVVRTVAAPTVVRFRPRVDTSAVERTANLSVRFTEPMNRATTTKAFSVLVGGKAIAGKVSFFENDTVLAFDPAAALPYDQTIVMRVASSATSATGVALTKDVTGTFTTVAKTAARTARTSGPITTTTLTPPAGAGAGAGTWTAVEAYYLDLMNCTRTGGLVTKAGACSSPGGRSVAPLALDAGISAKVARPYAKLLATRNLCSHFASGGPANRLRRAGYTSYNWAENLGCRSGNPAAAVLGSHLYFQAERAWSPVGGHYRNLMNAKYDRVGIGVWVYGGRVRLVVDFYHP
jgi:uncharacterized protein YkwD